MSFRAKKVLEEVDIILAEDTRTAKKLLSFLNLSYPKIISFFEHNEKARLKEVEGYLQAGKKVALLSEAGTPLLADPGFELIREIREKGGKITPIPGPSAVTAALMVAGIPPIPFTFLGFLPRKSGEIEKIFSTFAALKTTLVFFERKNRLKKTLLLAAKVLGKRQVCLAREITKMHEEFILGDLDSLSLEEEKLKGEFTVVIGPPLLKEKELKVSEIEKVLKKYKQQNLKPRELAFKVAQETGLTTSQVYELILKKK